MDALLKGIRISVPFAAATERSASQQNIIKDSGPRGLLDIFIFL